LPTLLAANKFAGLKPQAIPLAESAEGDPLLVAGQYGLGRTLALAVDSTWRWHRPGSIEHHKRFWRQAVLWLAQKEDTDQEEVWIKLARRRFDPTAEVTFAAGARSAAGDALAGASFAAQVIDPLGNETVVRLSPRDGEMFGAFPAARQAGKYTLVVTATQDGQPLGEARRQFQALDRDPETVDPVANPQHMAQLAKLTAEAGGKPLPAEQLAAQLEAILASPRDREVEQQTRWQLSDTTLDAWLVLLVVVGLLTGEWVLRKKWAMV